MITQEATNLMGGYGYHVGFDVGRLHRDAHGWAIAGGTATMREMRIAGELVGMRFPRRPDSGRARQGADGA